jgi:hypothetical protein
MKRSSESSATKTRPSKDLELPDDPNFRSRPIRTTLSIALEKNRALRRMFPNAKPSLAERRERKALEEFVL